VTDAGERPGDGHGDDHERDGADRNVDVEDPAPGEVVDENATEQRADDARRAEDGPEQPLVAAPLAGRHDIADDRLGADEQAAPAEPLDRPEGDELGHRLAEPRQDGPDQEDDNRGLEEPLAAVLVAELAPQRRRGGRREQVCRHDPRKVGLVMQVGDDRRQGGGDDRLVERREEEPEQQCADDQAPALGCERERRTGGRLGREEGVGHRSSVAFGSFGVGGSGATRQMHGATRLLDSSRLPG